ncbi:hypothetical protein [Pantoea agglomerans]|uniref:hypothetical protein n=1 Tax=Enterobacter agglomerans TaxID=549 RepID=UPI00178664BD|nr:hypothetical protein [Pantoea agglomerans]MBD8145825.1 hypothetical protein [Pantoea agglomerans]WVL82679.1 hypothetical protein IFT78_022790 [Pantoea agglomerans]WVL87891.1 hypothetical protein IFU02_026320 [Pantoea agglomerans]
MKREIRLSQRFSQKLQEQGDFIVDRVFDLIKKLESNEPIKSASFSGHASRKLYKYRLFNDILVIYALEERGEKETILLLDLVSYRDTYGLMRPAK